MQLLLLALLYCAVIVSVNANIILKTLNNDTSLGAVDFEINETILADRQGYPVEHRSKRGISRLIDYDDGDSDGSANFRVHRRQFNKNLITWRLSRFSDALDNAEVTNIIQRAFRAWSSVARIDFQEASRWDSVDIDIQFMDSSYDSSCDMYFGETTLAHCNYGSTPVRIHFSGAVDWSTAYEGDLYVVAMHEIGHAIGIGHSQYSDSVMYKEVSDSMSTTLTSDDIQAAQSLYGARYTGSNTGTTRGSLCTPNAFYCGHELSSLGYTNVVSDALYECDSDKDGLFHVTCGQGKCNGGSDIQSYCSCSLGVQYCGYELKRMNFVWSDLDEHTLYRCTSAAKVSEITTCSHKCEDNSRGDSECGYGSITCAGGLHYCGYELANRKHKGWKPHVLYECDRNSGKGNPIKTCYSGCVESDHSYCDSGRMARPRGRG